MKILHLCTDGGGGAANAALRLHQGLLSLGVDSVFGIKAGEPADNLTIAAPSGLRKWYASQAPRLEYHSAKWLHPKIRPVLPAYRFPGVCRSLIRRVRPDLVNLHWIDNNLVSFSDLRWIKNRGIPIVWTLHDMSPLSGGFHYREMADLPPSPLGPLTLPGAGSGVSWSILRRRAEALENARLTVVSPSVWLAEEAKHSPVFRGGDVRRIPYGIDTERFRSHDQMESRRYFGFPENSMILLFGADSFEDPRKGLSHLEEVVGYLSKKGLPLILVGFGNRHPVADGRFACPTRLMGRLESETELSRLYSAADLFVCPSREDNLPNTMIEALACGTPVAGFEIGGLPDLVKQSQTGVTVPPFDEALMAERIACFLQLEARQRNEIRARCRQSILEGLTLEHQATAYLREVYEPLLAGTSNEAGSRSCR
ncbi:glycosyltransferase [Haloferula sargassicola]|uniref:D-inositol-3-phosphate glycosyltransferase n=1 Tax=Haloferula sargassicola TaxID=490096 RepID=A0ABP9USJ8_9BACT